MNRKDRLEHTRNGLASVFTRFCKLMDSEEYNAVLHAIHMVDQELMEVAE